MVENSTDSSTGDLDKTAFTYAKEEVAHTKVWGNQQGVAIGWYHLRATIQNEYDLGKLYSGQCAIGNGNQASVPVPFGPELGTARVPSLAFLITSTRN
eukprot:3746527-Rhodomonas_salina.1